MKARLVIRMRAMRELLAKSDCRLPLPALLLCAVLAGMGACRVQAQGDDPQDFQNILGLTTYWYLDGGNCVQSIRQADNLGRLVCSRTPRINCAMDRRIDLTGNTIVTENTETRYRSAWASLVDSYPECRDASVAALSQAAFRASTPSEIESKNPSVFMVVADCDLLNGQNGPALIARVEHDFVYSPRGVLATQALSLSRNFIAGGGSGTDPGRQCFNSLTFFAWERALLERIADGNAGVEKACLYGASSGGLLPCSTEEKSVAASFDFTLPL